MDAMKLAHNLDEKVRSRDVILDNIVSFQSLLLSDNVLRGLAENGFEKPSPIQVKAVPLGKCGFDLIVKSKSGTGKTLVFSLIALETVNPKDDRLQILILVPTREIAVQIQDVLFNIGKFFEGLKIQSFIGGLPIEKDRGKCKFCHIAVGTPGRIKQLIKENILQTCHVRLFVLDEADKLMESSFENDINDIYNSLPQKKQVVTTSATYPNELDSFLSSYMLSPTFITVEAKSPLLLGLRQFVDILRPTANIVQQMTAKNERLLDILSKVPFTQCLVFSNYQTRASSISNMLNQANWNSMYISAAQSQSERLEAVLSLKQFKCRILLSTDLTARGIDAENVDLVINYDIPFDAMTYLHRMGRAGRYGSSGICINLASPGSELQLLQNILGIIGGANLSISKLPVLNGAVDLLSVNIPPEDCIFGVVPKSNDEINLNIKSEIMKMKDYTKIHNKKKQNKRTNVKENEDFTQGSIEMTESENVDEIKKQCVIENGDKTVLVSEGQNKDKRNTASEASNILLSSDEEKKHGFSNEKRLDEVSTFSKNRAMFSVAKALSGKQTDDDDTEAVRVYLSNMEAKEKSEIATFLDRTKSVNPKDIFTNIEDFTKNFESSTPNNKNALGKSYEDIMENIFHIGYKSATNSTAKNWKTYLPEKEISKLENSDTNEGMYEGEFYEDYDEEEEYFGVEEEELQTKYSNTIQETSKDDPDGALSNYNFMKWVPVDSPKEDPMTSQAYTQNADASDNFEHLSGYYSHCSEYLWQNGLNFESVSAFDEWFQYDWQAQVCAVRNFVQQNIYVEEMKRFQKQQQKRYRKKL